MQMGRLAGCASLVLLALSHAAVAQIISSDSSDLCNSNLMQCQSKCVAPQTFAFSCNQGDNFAKPTVSCQCVQPAMEPWDGAAVLKMVQAPQPGSCPNGDSWLNNCATQLAVNIQMNMMTAGQPGMATSAATSMAAQQVKSGGGFSTGSSSGAMMPSAASLAAPATLFAPSGVAAPPAGLGVAPAGGALGAAPAYPTAAPFPTAPIIPTAGKSGITLLPAPAAPVAAPALPGATAGALPAPAGVAPATAAVMPATATAAVPTAAVAPAAVPAAGAVAMPAATMPAAGVAPAAVPAGASASLLVGRRLTQFGADPTSVNMDLSQAVPMKPGVGCTQSIQGIVTGPASALLAIPGGELGSAKVMPNNMIVFTSGASGSCAAMFQLMEGTFLQAGRNMTAIAEAKNASAAAAAAAAIAAITPAAAGAAQAGILTALMAGLLAMLLGRLH